jgi:hypothetical protein
MRLALFIVSAFALLVVMIACYLALRLRETAGERDEARRFATAALASRSRSSPAKPPPDGARKPGPGRRRRDGAAGLALLVLAIVSWIREQPRRAAAFAAVLTVASATLFMVGSYVAHSPTAPGSASPPQTSTTFQSATSPRRTRRSSTGASEHAPTNDTDSTDLVQVGYAPSPVTTTPSTAAPSTTPSAPATPPSVPSPQSSNAPSSCLLYLQAPELLNACLG